ncbi:MAG TPA: erythromycin esterase family protein [Tepidisphaeraceae bacterium]|jgi:erythromycin esterase-like protein
MSLTQSLSKIARKAGLPLAGKASDFDPLIKAIGDARYVLIGEASHGTHEFYEMRAQITQRLITEQGFTGVVVESDWPDAYRVNRYVRGCPRDASAEKALSGFHRFPQWMWRNREVLEFVEWLRKHNNSAAEGQSKCGFYGMDLYSLYDSMEEVLKYLEKADPEAAKNARERYRCFQRYADDPQAYGRAASYGSRSCEHEAIAQLLDLQRRAGDLTQRDGIAADDEYFFAEQNARLVQNAEEYYREMFTGRVETWNLRDTHMTDTIGALTAHLDRTRKQRTKLVVWAHNSHLGDARHTESGKGGELNVGQLCRERWGEEVFNIGFTTHTGTVAAAENWGEDVQIKRVNPSMEGSWERVLHDAAVPNYALIFRGNAELAKAFAGQRVERAIGVIYRPQTERWSHYFNASLSKQFDAVIHIDETTAVKPLEKSAPFELDKAETYPSGV